VNLTLKVWRQASNTAAGAFQTYPVTDINEDMSFLEMLDVLNERLGEDLAEAPRTPGDQGHAPIHTKAIENTHRRLALPVRPRPFLVAV
jgi:hypothetical protein